ncbi:hypothetical protein EDB19DRAFT_1906537 [Suillus lakei]|nr:hypothetical protein EDB19DRAFT_1920944 [Suillus lakei]KAG1744825.1 hypothetical protein EDB19DRAFT_1906537 [Suillus lakei]
MAPPRWTSTEQLLWLQNEIPGYLQMQKEKKLPRFFDSLFPRWFSEFPEVMELDGSPPCDENVGVDEPDRANIETVIDTAQLNSINAPDSVEQEDSQSDSPPMGAAERRKKLREWFRNNSKGKTTPASGGSSAGRALSVLLGQRARGTRDLKEIEVYSKLHYESKVKPLVSDTLKNNVVQPTQRLSTVRQHTAECFADESEEVKKEIREETVRLNASRRLGDVVGQHPRTKEEVYRTIQELPLILGQVFEELSALTGGWHYTLVMGGADPLCEGDIMTLSYHHGKTADGLSFKASTPNFHEQYLLPFERHLGHIHGASSKCILAPSSTPTSSRLTPIDLITLDGSPNESSLGGNVMSGPVVDPSLLREQEILALNPYISNLDFGGSAGANEHADWLANTSSGDPSLIASPRNMADTPITAWRKSAPSSTPTSSSLAPIDLIPLDGSPNEFSLGGNVMSGPVVDPSLLREQENLVLNPYIANLDFGGSAGANEHADWLANTSSGDPNLIASPRNMADMPITAWKSMVLNEDPLTSPTFNRIQQRGSSTVGQSVNAVPPLLPCPLSPVHTTLLPQPSLLFSACEEVNALSTPVEHRSSPASHQQLPHDKPNSEVRTVSSPPIIPAASSRRSGRALHPSTRADGANKIGGYNPQHETKLAPKRKQTEAQRGAGGSKKKSRK